MESTVDIGVRMHHILVDKSVYYEEQLNLKS